MKLRKEERRRAKRERERERTREERGRHRKREMAERVNEIVGVWMNVDDEEEAKEKN